MTHQDTDRSAQYFHPYRDVDIHKNRLPHWSQGTVSVFITWRLSDSLPATKLSQWEAERRAWLRQFPYPWDEATEHAYHERFSRQMEDWLDKGYGSCMLRDHECSAMVGSALRHFDGHRYQLQDFVVMPNHVHVLVRPMQDYRLQDVIRSWKGYSARCINQHAGRKGSLWQNDYWDRLIRNRHHEWHIRKYIQNNPQKAGLKTGDYLLGP